MIGERYLTSNISTSISDKAVNFGDKQLLKEIHKKTELLMERTVK